MNKGGWMSMCDCPCGCKIPSWSRDCFMCGLFHIRLIRKRTMFEKENIDDT